MLSTSPARLFLCRTGLVLTHVPQAAWLEEIADLSAIRKLLESLLRGADMMTVEVPSSISASEWLESVQ